MTKIFKDTTVEDLGAIGKAVLFENNGKHVHFPVRTHNAFVYFLSGKIDFIYDGNVISAQKDSFVFLPQGKAYKTLPYEKGEFLIINFSSSNTFCENAFSFSPNDKENFIFELKNAVKAQKYKKAGYEFTIKASIYSLCALIEKEQQDSIHPAYIKKIQPCLDFLKENPDATVLELAKIINVSTKYFTRLFLETMHTTPKQYIISLRMENALKLLKENIPVSIVAENCGFCDVYYFSRLFKKHTGMTPTEYKNSFL